ncbi:hypothetical protein J2M53_02730 [Arthrobacter sp. zg-ZUI100]|uniref:Uncharacterized protein n=1 Tax=Arthrobacter jiangjiafuii TaxID=2817475 RepID=A0A975M4A4_9MICC|nr:hypothetical protein [Arthrobacter jiangjiafuii]MBP3035170.1 hypothetical protein [Arthrobacter jiangjiafuii]MBP3042638.1 hypothetical protein [Arthrobacter jiangjiafuii]QWC09637.1 hypothetical protein KKR91_14335 [Arthrobacter jiangjiafuii]
MCRAVTCRNCRKMTWAGCGQHVQQVMAHIPRAERCSCAANPPAGNSAAPKGWLARLFSR